MDIVTRLFFNLADNIFSGDLAIIFRNIKDPIVINFPSLYDSAYKFLAHSYYKTYPRVSDQ